MPQVAPLAVRTSPSGSSPPFRTRRFLSFATGYRRSPVTDSTTPYTTKFASPKALDAEGGLQPGIGEQAKAGAYWRRANAQPAAESRAHIGVKGGFCMTWPEV